jgi:hypothetical protein
MRVQEEVGRHHDGAEEIVEVVRHITGEPADGLHLLLLNDLIFERALLGGVERIDDRRLLIALLLLDRGHIEAGRAIAGAFKHGIDRGDIALPGRRPAQRRLERCAVALRDHRQDRAVVGALALVHRMEQPCKQRVRARDPALLVDGRDRHRGIVEEAHETHFGSAQWVGTAVAGAIEDEGARGTSRAVGPEHDLVEKPNRNGAAIAGLEVDVETLGFHVAGSTRERGEESRALAGHHIGKPQTARADLRQIVVEPFGERRVEIGEVAVGIDREEARRRMVEIVDGVLQLLKDVLLPLELAGHVGERPHRHRRCPLAVAQRPHPHAQPPPGLALVAADSDFLL